MGQTGIKADFTGFARVAEYTKRNGAFGELTSVYEGIIKQGQRKGFGRYINADTRTSFIGPLDGDHATYKGLFFKDFDTKHIGVWSNAGTMQRYNARPAAAFWFTDFGFETVVATEPEIDPETGIRTWPDGSQTNPDGTPVTDYYGDRGDDYNPYLIDEYKEEQARPSESEPATPEEPPSDWEGEEGEEWQPEPEEECAWDDDECWANMEYDWQAGDDDMFADWGDEWEDEWEDEWDEGEEYYEEEDWGQWDAEGEDGTEEFLPEYESFFADETIGDYEYDTNDFATSYDGWDINFDEEEEVESAGDDVEDPNAPESPDEDPNAPETPEEDEEESDAAPAEPELSKDQRNVESQCFAWAEGMLMSPDFFYYGDNSYT